MNDPFFDEDDGEFDDLYGNARPSSSSSKVKPKRRNNEAPVAEPVTPVGRPSTRSPEASSSVVSRSYARDRTNSSISTATDLAASGKQDKRRKKHVKTRRKGSQELFDVQWQSDVQVTKCGLCRADFSLVKRKHHCRHCGRVMCSDCSSFLYFEFSHRKHRVCATCNNQLLAEQEAYDRETLAGGQERDTTISFDDSSEGRRLSSTSSHNNFRSTLKSALTSGDDKEKKKQEKKERKEKRKQEEKKETQVTMKIETSRKQAGHVEEKPNALFDGADDDWFTDVQDQQTITHDSGDDYSDHGGSKGPGWSDRVKDTYSVTAASERTSVLAPMTGNTLTAGITGKGYISDQFRYDDVGGPGLGHDDDYAEKMPQPKQQSATTTYTDHSVKPTRLTGNGYYSNQFQYDDVGGPGLGHEVDRSLAMPRPKQQPYNYGSTKRSPRQSEHDNPPLEQDFQPRHTFKENIKDMLSGPKRRESTAKKKAKASKPRARGNESMTMDELNLSYSSEDEPRTFASTTPCPTLTSAQPTFYDNDADKLVVDDSPGFFEATIAEREAKRKKEEEQQQQLASDIAWVNSSALPPTVPAHRFSSGQESYSIVELPSHTSNSPVESHRDGLAGGDATGNGKGGFTRALKRFFGMGSKATEKKATTPPKSFKPPPTPVVTAPEKFDADNHPSVLSDNSHPTSSLMAEPASAVLDYYGATRENRTPEETFRYTTTGVIDSKDVNTRFEASGTPRTGDRNQNYEEVQQKLERKRRGTFDDLFESPKNHVAMDNGDRYTTTGASGWASRVGESTNANQASYGAAAVGVSRFDQRRSIDESDEFTLGDEPQSILPPTHANDSIEGWKQSASLSILDSRKDATHPEGSGFTWSNVRSVPGVGTATYAVPTSLQPRAVHENDRESSSQYDTSVTQPASLGNIMDDLKRGSTSKKSQGKESIDDFFAEFEEPNDYVFDPATGGYVASRVPPRAAVTRHASRSESTELLSPQPVPGMDFRRSSERDCNAPSVPIASSTDLKMDGNREEVEDQDEVADIIVDKISSLESELAALKQLIRNRKGSGGSNKPSASHSSTKRSVRKESIFDNDSSDEDDGKPIDPYSSSIRPVSTQASKQGPASKKKQVKKHRDSFADLFEDSPKENETLGGATSYEALFQTGTNMAGENIEVDSDDDTELTPKRAKPRPKSRRRSSRKINYFVATKEHSDSEPEFTSLKGRRGKHTSRRKKNEEMGDSTVKLGSRKTEDELVTPTLVDVIPIVKPVKKHLEEEDPIDALFDTSNDRDVTKLYGGDGAHDGEHMNSAFEAISAPIVKGNSALSSQQSSTSLTDDETSGIPSSTADGMESMTRTSSSLLDPLDLEKAEEEEDFSINWTKMRKTKSRRHKARRNSSDSSKSIGESRNTTENLALEPNLSVINAELKVEENDAPTKREEPETSSPNIFLADDASNWMSISTLKEEMVLTGDGDLESLLQAAGENKDAESIVITNDDKQEIKQETVATSVSMGSPIPIENVAPISSSTDVMSVEHVEILLSEVNIMEEPSGLTAKVKTNKQEDAAFDIFDKSGDMDFLPAITLTDLKTSSHEGDEGNSDNDDEESLPGDGDAFTFEVKAPKKRLSVNVLTSISSTPHVSERRESPPPSPAPSADENVEFGKYATTSVSTSSRTPSVDGSLNDPEEPLVDGEPVLGKVESQAFDTDWQQMQAKEKERKKRLQVKQRQAQRDKVLRKQGVSSKSLASSAIQGSSKSKSSKKKDKDATARSSSHHKKSGSSRKHRHREKEDAADNAGVTTTEPPRSLTEL